MNKIILIVCATALFINLTAQRKKFNFTADGNGYTQFTGGQIVSTNILTNEKTTLLTKEQLNYQGKGIKVQSFEVSADGKHILIFANTKKVWRYNTKGDYFLLSTATNTLRKLGTARTEQSLQFAKFNAAATKVAYVSESNIYVEDVATNNVKALTTNGSRKFINGTFDWVYEEEFGLRDGFRWNPDGSSIAFWQIDATKIKDYYMLNTTDDNYSKVIPVEYPKVGEDPSPAKIGVVNISTGNTQWMNIAGDPVQHYITKLDWASSTEVLVQQLDRKQQVSKLINCNPNTGVATVFYTETDKAWVDIQSAEPFGNSEGFKLLNKGAEILWVSEKDGWRHIYRISKDGKNETLLTPGNFDIAELKLIDEKNNVVYYTASPNNPIQRYLYYSPLVLKNKQKQTVTLATPEKFNGTSAYTISPNGAYAYQSFSSHKIAPTEQWVTLPNHKVIGTEAKLNEVADNGITHTTITTADNITLDAWVNLPIDFDATKKYPVVMYVYGEPAASTVDDEFGVCQNFLYEGNMRADGYIQVTIDNRGTPVLKGANWRKQIYRNIGRLNPRDLAQGMQALLAKNNYMDKSRVAVWGWSGGGSSTLNLMFQYPEIFQTGISIAAVGNQLFYDNIYQERYMGLPQENRDDFVQGSPMTHAKNLKGKLLYIHGTGDDNVHYSNAEVLLNELIKHKKLFQFMAYPNRSHSISEGAGTFPHLMATYTNFLQTNCPAGAR